MVFPIRIQDFNIKDGLQLLRPSFNIFIMISRDILVCLFLSLSQIPGYGQQNTWETLYATPMNEIAYDVIEHADGSIFLSGQISKPNELQGHSEGVILKLNKHGVFIDKLQLGKLNRRYLIGQLFWDSFDSLIAFGYSSDTLMHPFGGYENMNLELRRIDTNLISLYEKTYSFPPQYRKFICEMNNGIFDAFLIGGSINPFDSSGIAIPFIYILDSNLDSVDARFYLNQFGWLQRPKQLRDSTIWMINSLVSSYYIIDNSMHLVEYEYARPHYINNPYGIKWDTDTSFYLTGEWDEGNDHDIGIYRQIHPIDSSSSTFISWGTSSLDIPAENALDFINKDSIFIGGTKGFGMYYGTWPSWYYILQADSNLNIRWERFYGGDAYYCMQKIIAAKDGGCIIVGTRYDYQNVTEEELDIHVLKLNSEGLLVSTPEEPSIEMREALVLPNPGTNYLKVRVAAHYKHSTFELYDINGRIMLAERINGKWGEINTSSLPSGTYIYRVYNEEGLFESGKWLKR